MATETLQAALLARSNDPRALRGAITIVSGMPRIVFGVVGDHRRFSVDIDGNELKLVDDPRADEAGVSAEATTEADASAATPEASAPKGRKPRTSK